MLLTIFLGFLLSFFPSNDATSVTKHTINVDGKNLSYTATAGFMPLTDSEGKIEANIFYIAYTADTNEKRPLTFSFNGGPGSASVWLHLGAIGPKRVKMLPNGFMPPPPYKLETNQHTWLTETDLVFIDPVGTGYSRAVDPKNQKFFSLAGDIASVGEFIRLYLSQNKRWMSPLFLVGESYGTTRAAGLSGYLIDRGIAFNGISLISSVLSFQTIRFADTNDLPLVLILPSYSATAWYHKKLPQNLQSKPLRDVLREAERFAVADYGPSMLRIGNLTSAERSELAARYANFTGLSPEYVLQNNFRIELGSFLKEIGRDQRRVMGRLDSRFTGIENDAGGDNTSSDPSMTAIRPPYTAAINDYLRSELGFESDLEYYVLGGGVGRWNWNSDNGYADTGAALRKALQQNPYMKVFIASGYYDMATPYFATEYTISNLDLDPVLRKNISFRYFEAGHMMYIDEGSLRELTESERRFIRDSKGQ
ncbi:MAG: hypothetical protein R2684_10470 [Pyrinomonadaceae bacterium]